MNRIPGKLPSRDARCILTTVIGPRVTVKLEDRGLESEQIILPVWALLPRPLVTNDGACEVNLPTPSAGGPLSGPVNGCV